MRSADYPKSVPPLTRVVGGVCVAALKCLRRLPSGAGQALLSPLLPGYPLIRPKHAQRLRACFAASPFGSTLSLDGYYRMRLHLLLKGLRLHGKPASPGPDCRIEGEREFALAADGTRPVALLGLHAGLFEHLHRIPTVPAGKPFLILTAPTFSPALTAFMAQGREAEGKNILWIGRDGEKGLERGLRRVIADKGVLALMADQHPGPAVESEYLPLWDRIAVPYPKRLLRFLAAQGFAVVPVSIRLEGEERSVLRFHPAWDNGGGPGIAGEPGLGDELIRDRVRAFLEESIAAAPEQWNWSYPKIHPISGARDVAAG